MGGRAGLVAGAIAFAAACTSFSSEEDEQPLSALGADGGDAPTAPPDASGPRDDAASDSTRDARAPGTLLAEDFEQTSGCGALTGSGVTLERVTTTSASGTASCKICLTSPGTRTASVKVAHAGTGRYRFEARVHDTADGGTWFASIDFLSGGVDTNDGVTNTGVLPSEWTLAQVIREPTKPRDAVVGSIGAEGATGYCFYVDDLLLVFEPAAK